MFVAWGAVMGSLRHAGAEISTEAAIAAVQREVCRADFWRRGRTLPAKIRKDGDLAYVLVRGLIGRLLTYTFPPSDKLYRLYTREGEVAVWRQGPWDPNDQAQQSLFAGPTEAAWFTEPTDCNFPFVDSPMKLRFLKVVEQTMVKQLSDLNRRGFRKLPPRVEIVIENFNFDDFETSVLVPITGDVWDIVFHSGRDPLHDTSLEDQEFPAKAWDPKNAKRYRARILAKGLRREIQLHE
jgi:hypothetical protein